MYRQTLVISLSLSEDTNRPPIRGRESANFLRQPYSTFFVKSLRFLFSRKLRMTMDICECARIMRISYPLAEFSLDGAKDTSDVKYTA